ncbi:MAG: hypothetical protein KIT36_05580 [Alphaproteobacteria bacterium]|nr:hypothetical protein [Alphaproteobacteria bacterium]
MAIDDATVRAHIGRALESYGADPSLLQRLTRAYRLLQAERRVPGAEADEALAAAEHYLFARQAVASNTVNLSQMLIRAIGDDITACAVLRLDKGAAGGGPVRATMPASQDCIGWGVAGAVQGEADRQAHLPGSHPPPFKPVFMGNVPARMRRELAAEA